MTHVLTDEEECFMLCADAIIKSFVPFTPIKKQPLKIKKRFKLPTNYNLKIIDKKNKQK